MLLNASAVWLTVWTSPLISVNIGEGNMDFTENSNEFVNPGEKLWKWKTIEDRLREL